MVRLWIALLLVAFAAPVCAQQQDDVLERGVLGYWVAAPPTMGGPAWKPSIGTDAGTLVNMTSATASGWQPTMRPGGAGEMRFDGTDDQVNVGTTKLVANLTSFTVCLWFRSTSTIGQQLYTENVGAWPDMMIAIGWVTDEISFNNYDNSGGLEIHGPPPSGFTIGGNSWQHVCGVQYTKSSGDVYANGRRITTGMGGSLGAVAPTLRSFGASPQGANRLIGAMDRVRTYNRALNASEIWQLYVQSSLPDDPRSARQRVVTFVDLITTTVVNRNSFFPFFSPTSR